VPHGQHSHRHCCLCVLLSQESAADFRERISDKYSRIRTVLDGDERLMMQIIDAEETYTTEWLETQRATMETLMKDADSLRAQSRELLQETNDLTFVQVAPNSPRAFEFVFVLIVRGYHHCESCAVFYICQANDEEKCVCFF